MLVNSFEDGTTVFQFDPTEVDMTLHILATYIEVQPDNEALAKLFTSIFTLAEKQKKNCFKVEGNGTIN